MTTIAVVPNPTGEPGYRAVANGTEAAGATVGAAIDALVAQTGTPDGTTVILVRQPGGDEFFSAAQQARLGELMGRWRQARDSGLPFAAEERAELDSLIAAELRASAARTAAALAALKP